MTAVVTIDSAAVRAMTNRGSIVNQDMERRALKVESQAKLNVRVNTGRLRSSGLTQPASDREPGAYEVVFTVDYSLFQDQGTRFMVGTFFLSNAIQVAVT